MAMAEPADINVDELRRRARRRLVGAVVLALGVAVIVPMLLETEQKPLGEDVTVKIPPIDDSKFVNRLSENRAKTSGKSDAPTKDDAAKDAAVPSVPAGTASGERTSKYDTRLTDGGTGAAPSTTVAPVPPPSATGTGSAPSTSATSGPAAPGGTASVPSSPTTTGQAAVVNPPKPPEGKAAPTSAAPGVVDAARPAPADKPPPRADVKPPAPQSVPSPPAAHASATDAKAPALHDGFAVQLAAFADDKGANALAGRLKRAGYTAYTEPLKTSKGTLWRVRVGPYASREAAVAARDQLKAEGQSGIVAAVK
jgi:DedD protein